MFYGIEKSFCEDVNMTLRVGIKRFLNINIILVRAYRAHRVSYIWMQADSIFAHGSDFYVHQHCLF